MKTENMDVELNGEVVLMKGEWTLLISKKELTDIFIGNYNHSPNDGLFQIPSTSKTCLSILPIDVAKISLTQSQICEIQKILSK